jgi:AcrR family transcriptional regulator
MRLQPRVSGQEAILDAAIAEFSEKGFEGATTAAIARAANVTQPLVHFHFGNKEGLWRAAMERLFGELRSSFAGAALDSLKDLGPRDQLKIILRQFVAFSARRPELARIMTREGARRTPRLELLLRAYVRPQFEALEHAIRRAMKAGAIRRTSVPLLAFVFVGAATHLFTVPAVAADIGIDAASAETAAAFADVLVESLFAGLAM